jgi:uncharacterized membrane protein
LGDLGEACQCLQQKEAIGCDPSDAAQPLGPSEETIDCLGLATERRGELAQPRRAKIFDGEQRADALPQPLIGLRQPQPIVKFAFAWWPNPIAAVVVSYTVSSAVLIVSALARAGGTIPDIDHRGALWFGAVGLCNGLAVLTMYAVLESGPVAIISPLIAGYPLVTLLLSRAFLAGEDVGRPLIAGVTGVVCGVVLLLVA